MRNIPANLIMTIVFMLTLSVSLSFPHNSGDEFFRNPLLLNDKVVDPTAFSTASIGKLSMVKGDPESGRKIKVPFYAYIKRSGFIIDGGTYARNRALTEVDITQLLKFAKAGDQLVIDPANKNDEIGRRVITVHQAQLAPIQMKWLYGVIKQKNDGC